MGTAEFLILFVVIAIKVAIIIVFVLVLIKIFIFMRRYPKDIKRLESKIDKIERLLNDKESNC